MKVPGAGTRIAVMVSGAGTNLQCLLDEYAGADDRTIAAVLSDRPDAGGLGRARRAGVPAHVLADPADGAGLLELLARYEIQAVILAGYLKLVPERVVSHYEGRMINIHPALLPSFGGPGMYGRRVHVAVLASGVTVTGPTVHLVTAEYDRGPVLAQWPVAVLPDDTPEQLAARVLEAEHRLLPAVVAAAAADGCFRRLTSYHPHFHPIDGPPDIPGRGP